VIRLALFAVLAVAAQQTFRSQVDLVTISASVKKGNTPVVGLTASDFRVTDNGVVQAVELLTVESVPIDVTLFLDTSGSTGANQERMKRDVRAIAAMLRPADRYRVITIGLSVDEAIPWQAAGAEATLRLQAVPGISLIYDAVATGLLHPVETGRRHLIVALTDGEDCGSVVDGPTLFEISRRTEAVLHFVYWHGPGGYSPDGAMAWCTPYDDASMDFLTRAAERTGGARHASVFGNPTVKTFARILDDFRASYVLRYSAQGVRRPGWHTVTVAVPGGRAYNVRARSGYFVVK
jgi:VWFA-related protein